MRTAGLWETPSFLDGVGGWFVGRTDCSPATLEGWYVGRDFVFRQEGEIKLSRWSVKSCGQSGVSYGVLLAVFLDDVF